MDASAAVMPDPRASPAPSLASSSATPLMDNRTPPPPSRGGRTPQSRGGRTPMSGRGLVPAASGPRPYQQQARMPMQVHASSGVPFGHVPAYLPGAASLVEELDQRILIVLRDGKHIIGTLVSFDQFGNLVLKDAVDRQIVRVPDDPASPTVRHCYADLPLDGLYIARGESLVLVGQVHDAVPSPLLQSVSLEELGALSARALRPLEWDFDTDLIA